METYSSEFKLRQAVPAGTLNPKPSILNQVYVRSPKLASVDFSYYVMHLPPSHLHRVLTYDAGGLPLVSPQSMWSSWVVAVVR